MVHKPSPEANQKIFRIKYKELSSFRPSKNNEDLTYYMASNEDVIYVLSTSDISEGSLIEKWKKEHN